MSDSDHVVAMETVSDERLAEMLAGLEGVTPGPWGVWREPTFTQADAIRELTFQVESTPIADFAKAVYLLDAGGKCPATTGCGPSSAANAAHIARLAPETVRSIISELLASRLAKQAPAWQDVIAERQRQVEAEGWTAAHDDQHDRGEMAAAAGCYALGARLKTHEVDGPGSYVVPEHWPWDGEWWKTKTRRQDLVRAGALILAEIERLDRLAPSPVGGGVS